MLTAIDLLLSSDQKFWHIVLLTIQINFSATILGIIIGVPIGAWLATDNTWYKNILTTIFDTLLGLPPLIAGLIVYILFSYQGIFGSLRWLYSWKVIIIAQTLLVLPITIALSRRVILSSWNRYIDDLTVLGYSKASIIRTLIYECRYSLLAVGLIGYGRALSEVGAVLIVGGNIEGQTRTLTTAISLESSKGNIGFAIALGIILIFMSLIVTLLFKFIKRHGQKTGYISNL